MPQRRGKDDLLPPPPPAGPARFSRDLAACHCRAGQAAEFALVTKLTSVSMTFHFINVSDDWFRQEELRRAGALVESQVS